MASENRLIDANALKIHRMHNAGANHPLDVAYRKDIDNAPTVDAVEVVRCKDCKHCDFFYPIKEMDKEPIPAWYCRPQKSSRKPDDYCSYGERK